MPRPFGEVALRETVTAVAPVVAGMIDADDDEPGLGERQGRIVMVSGAPAGSVREHDQRQLLTRDRTIRRDNLAEQAQWLRNSRRVAGIPDDNLQGLVFRIRNHDFLEPDRAGGS